MFFISVSSVWKRFIVWSVGWEIVKWGNDRRFVKNLSYEPPAQHIKGYIEATHMRSSQGMWLSDPRTVWFLWGAFFNSDSCGYAGELTTASILDVEQAFDCVWHGWPSHFIGPVQDMPRLPEDQISVFADDMAVYVAARKRLQRQLCAYVGHLCSESATWPSVWVSSSNTYILPLIKYIAPMWEEELSCQVLQEEIPIASRLRS